MQISASVYSQGTKITLNLTNTPLRSVLNVLEKETNYTFFYNEDFIDLNKIVSVKVTESNMNSLLKVLFSGTDLTYNQIEDKVIVIAPAKFQQKITVMGKITDSGTGEPVGGVTVLEKGTNNGTVSDANGKYTITVADAKSVIVFSFLGYNSQELATGGRNEIDLQLVPNVTALNEIVVTALGIQKTARSLTYASQQVGNDDITDVKNANLMTSLSGKSAGLVITQGSAGPGGSSRIVIRGNKSIGGSNEPLYVVDGMPLNNSNLGQIGGSTDLAGVVDGGDAISNINPEDIESISVLKGASASALYGGSGENGVILITTKKGSAGKTTVEFTSSSNWDSPLILPKLQSQYGSANTLNTASTSNVPWTWGTTAGAGNAIGTSDLNKFYQTGLLTINGISISSGNDKNLLYISYANTYSNGITPGNSLQKNNFFVKGSSKLTDCLTAEGTATLITQDVYDRPFVGWQSNPVADAYFYGGTQAAWSGYKSNYQVYNPVSNMWVQNYPYSSYNTTNYILDNPWWDAYKNPNTNNRNRDIFTGSLKWDITKNISIKARGIYDRTSDQFEQDVYASSSSVDTDPYGAYLLTQQTALKMYSDVLLTYANDKLGDFSVNVTLGATNDYSKNYNLDVQTLEGNNNMYAPNVFSMTNLIGIFNHTESSSQTLGQSVFGTGSFGFKNMIFVDLTDRNEWNSTVAPQTYNYPSVGGSFVFSELTGVNNAFSFGKLRASYSEVGNALPPYVNNSFNTQLWTTQGGLPQAPQVGIILGQPLKPERSQSFEVGGNIRLFSNALDLDVTYYNNNVINQFLEIPAPPGGFYPNYYVNAGEVNNKGVEIVLSYKTKPTQDGVQWATSINFAYNKNSIISVDDAASINNYSLNLFANTKIAQTEMVKGGQFGDLYAYVDSVANGKVVLSQSTPGAPVQAKNMAKVGNPNSPTTFGWGNTFTYKGFALKFLIDAKIGGQIISGTEANLDLAGRSERSGDARTAGTVTYNGETVANTQAQIQNWFVGQGNIAGNYVYNATAWRLRELSLAYSIPTGFTNGKIKNITLSLFGKNLFFIYNNAPMDPEVSASSQTALQGTDAFNVPSVRSFGFSVKATF